MSSTIFSSKTSQQRWIDQLNDHFVVYVENPPSIFQVPKSILDTNPDAYAPQEIGIGPYHHFRPDLDDMESRKLGAIKTFLEPEQFHNFRYLVVDKVRTLEPLIRSYYDKYLDLDSDTLAWAMAIDGVFLLHLLSKYKLRRFGRDDVLLHHTTIHDGRKVAGDVLMMENQFPCVILNQIRDTLFQHGRDVRAISSNVKLSDPTDESFCTTEVPSLDQHEEEEEDSCDIFMAEQFDESKDREELLSEMFSFCESQSPLDIGWQVYRIQIKDSHQAEQLDRITMPSPSDIGWDAPQNSPHILDLMYRLLVLKLSSVEPVTNAAFDLPTLRDIGAQLIGLDPLDLVADLPYQECFNLFGNAKSSKNSSTKEIRIPSVSQLHQAAKIQFRNSSCQGRAVVYYEDTRMLYLPMIRLTTNSEVILRNLVAYESALGSNDNVVSGFVDFMCGLIDTAKDVDLL